MTVECHQCGDTFDTYTDLARHITVKKHRKGRRWAAKLLLQVGRLDKKKDFDDRVPLSEEDKESRRELRDAAQVSGEKIITNTKCPKCGNWHSQYIEVEYARSETAWRTEKGTLLILCGGCKK